jgi:hypothetical protein
MVTRRRQTRHASGIRASTDSIQNYFMQVQKPDRRVFAHSGCRGDDDFAARHGEAGELRGRNGAVECG